MALINLKCYSESLGMQTSVIVVMPQKSSEGEIGVAAKSTDAKPKCLYLLHGLTDDETIWLRRTSIERYATEHGICVIMPDGARSFYSDMKTGMNYYTFIAKELPGIIESMFNVSDKSEDRYIGGNSMGGYGALKLALSETGRYNAAFALSPVTDLSRFPDTMQAVFGDDIPDSADLYKLSDMHNNDSVKPRLYVTIGKDDYMYEDNVEFNKHMQKLDYNYKYLETEGDHSWELWDVMVQKALNWILTASSCDDMM